MLSITQELGRRLLMPLSISEAADEMAWTELAHSREEINRAGKALVDWYSLDNDRLDHIFELMVPYQKSIPVINNWRACHGYPLNILQTNLRRAARRIEESPLIAQRTKRLYSIQLKLRRQPSMKLSQMQDIGGCRAVLANVDNVRKLDSFYSRGSEMKHELATHDDYIASPKETGYRGIHRVYRYHSDKAAGSRWNGLKVEFQFRSQYQHAWATAVETVGTFLGQALKSSSGSDEWLRFFALMSSVIAFREKAPTVPGTPDNYQDLLEELRHHARELNVAARLQGYTRAIRFLEERTEHAAYYLLRLDPEANQLLVTGYMVHQFDEAQAAFSKIESEGSGKGGTDAVLVSVDSISNLQKAYPNYFADTRVFVELLKQALSGHERRIQTPSSSLKPAS